MDLIFYFLFIHLIYIWFYNVVKTLDENATTNDIKNHPDFRSLELSIVSVGEILSGAVVFSEFELDPRNA